MDRIKLIIFNDDEDGTVPNGWTDASNSLCETSKIASSEGHDDIIRLYDNSGTGDCKKFLALPKLGKIELLKSVCMMCSFNITKISTNVNGIKKIYFLSPKLWNDGLKKRIRNMGFCNYCRSHFIDQHEQCKKRSIIV